MHDRSGKPLKIGDKINLPCVITQASPGSEACELGLESEIPMHEGSPFSLWVNSKQVDKIEE